MKKAIKIGFFTGIIISMVLISATYVRQFLPDTFTANLLFFVLFFAAVVLVLWYSLHLYCKSSAVKWMSLSLTGIISSAIAALLVSVHGYVYGLFDTTPSLGALLQSSTARWEKTNEAAGFLLDSWFGNPLNYALYHFGNLVLVLFLLSLLIAAVYYLRHRKRSPYHESSKNHELIF